MAGAVPRFLFMAVPNLNFQDPLQETQIGLASPTLKFQLRGQFLVAAGAWRR
jgi:hypothetical protein